MRKKAFKRVEKRKINLKKLVPYMILILVVMLSIAYSAFSSNMNISGIVADVRIIKDARITGVRTEVATATAAGACTWTDSDSSGDINVSDVVTCGTESFYVMYSDSSTVTMLTAKNIEVTTSNPVQSDNAGTIAFSDSIYWNNGGYNVYYSTNSEKVQNGIMEPDSEYPSDAYYAYENNSHNLIYPYVEAYVNTIKGLGVTNVSGRLISTQELIDLGCQNGPSGICSLSWLNGTNYLTGSVFSGSNMMEEYGNVWFKNNNQLEYHSYLNTNYGIRPVIEIPLSNFISVQTFNGSAAYLDYNVNSISSEVTLPDSDSRIKFIVEITNIGNAEVGILDITGLPNNLTYELDNYTLKDKICSSNSECSLGITKEIELTVKYKDGYYNSENTTFDIKMDFDIEQFYSVNYTYIDGSYPTEILGGDTLTVNFGNNAPLYIDWLRIDGVSTDNYTYSNGALTFPNVNGNVDVVGPYIQSVSSTNGTVVAQSSKISTPKSLKIYGNSIQNGTPTPSNPIIIQSVGEKESSIISTSEQIIPSEYQQLQYIRSTGTQYIDTGVIANQNTGFDIKFYSYNTIGTSGYGSIFGARYSSRNREIQLTTYGTASSGGTLRWETQNVDAGLKVGEIVEASARNKTYTKPNGSTADLSEYNDYTTPSTVTIFALNQRGTITQYGSLRLYYFRMYDGDTLIRNFIPCYRKSDNVAGLYDLVTNTFYTNQGSGSFLTSEADEDSIKYKIQLQVSRLPVEYQEIEYIENTGAQYINTGYIPNDTSGVEVKISTSVRTDNVVLGARQNPDTNTRWLIGVNRSGSPARDAVYGGWNSNDTAATRAAYTADVPFVYQLNYLNNRKRISNDVEYTAINTTLTEIEYPAYIFGYNNGGSIDSNGAKKIYYVKFTEGNSIIRYFIPCYRKSDGVVGMYDIVTNTFYTNAGTGTFIRGPYVQNTYDIYLDEPLRKVGDYSDYIDLVNKKVVRKIGSLKFNGNDSSWNSWSGSITSNSMGLYYSNNNILGSYSQGMSGKFYRTIGLSTHFILTTEGLHTQNDSLMGKFFLAPTSNPPYIGFKVPYTSLDDWKNFLITEYQKGVSVEVNVVWATPVEESIDIPNINLNDDYTYISVDTTIKPTIELEYYKNTH